MSFIRSALSMQIDERYYIIQEINKLISEGIGHRYTKIKIRLSIIAIKKEEEIQLLSIGHELNKRDENCNNKYKLSEAESQYYIDRNIEIIEEYREFLEKEAISEGLRLVINKEIDTLNTEIHNIKR